MSADTPVSPEASSADAMAKGTPPPPLIYRASGGRKTFFSFAFLILFPFFASLPAMIYTRLMHGLWFDTVGLAIFAACFTAVMFLLLVELMLSIRSRVVLGPRGVKLTLPANRGPTPVLRYQKHKFDYDDVESVETQRTVYGGSLAPVFLKSAHVTKKDGETINLGYVSEANVDQTFPFPVIAKHIADRARLPLIERGAVLRSARADFLKIRARAQAGDPAVRPITDEEIEDLNHRHRTVMLALLGAITVLLLIGVAADLASEDPIGVGAGLFN